MPPIQIHIRISSRPKTIHHSPNPTSSSLPAKMRLAQSTIFNLESPGYLTASSFLLAQTYGPIVRNP